MIRGHNISEPHNKPPIYHAIVVIISLATICSFLSCGFNKSSRIDDKKSKENSELEVTFLDQVLYIDGKLLNINDVVLNYKYWSERLKKLASHKEFPLAYYYAIRTELEWRKFRDKFLLWPNMIISEVNCNASNHAINCNIKWRWKAANTYSAGCELNLIIEGDNITIIDIHADRLSSLISSEIVSLFSTKIDKPEALVFPDTNPVGINNREQQKDKCNDSKTCRKSILQELQMRECRLYGNELKDRYAHPLSASPKKRPQQSSETQTAYPNSLLTESVQL